MSASVASKCQDDTASRRSSRLLAGETTCFCSRDTRVCAAAAPNTIPSAGWKVIYLHPLRNPPRCLVQAPRLCLGGDHAPLQSNTAVAMIARDFELDLDEPSGPVCGRFSFAVIPDGPRVGLRERVRQTSERVS
jgi:hypothetical protein